MIDPTPLGLDCIHRVYIQSLHGRDQDQDHPSARRRLGARPGTSSRRGHNRYGLHRETAPQMEGKAMNGMAQKYGDCPNSDLHYLPIRCEFCGYAAVRAHPKSVWRAVVVYVGRVWRYVDWNSR